MDASELKLLATEGDTGAQLKLAGFYESGSEGVEEDEGEALKWYRLSAENYNAVAQERLGWIYYMGMCGVDEDEGEALKWFQLSAKQGNANALEQVGTFHDLGLGGLNESDTEALKWYQAAAEKGNAGAAEKVGDFYYLGRGGILANNDKAREWYQRSIVAGDSIEKYQLLARDKYLSDRGQKRLGDIYFFGLCGTPIDKEEALQWYQKASNQMNRVALQRMVDFEEELELQRQAVEKNRRYRRLTFFFAAAFGSVAITLVVSGLFQSRDSERKPVSVEISSDGLPSADSRQSLRLSESQKEATDRVGPSNDGAPVLASPVISSEHSSESVIQICESESNVFSKNNCRWQQCAKAENKDRSECVIFQNKGDASR